MLNFPKLCYSDMGVQMEAGRTNGGKAPSEFENFTFSYSILSKKRLFSEFWVGAPSGKIVLATPGKIHYWSHLGKNFRRPCTQIFILTRNTSQPKTLNSLKYRHSAGSRRLGGQSYREHMRVQWGKKMPWTPKFLAYLFVLCFKRQCPKPNTVTRLKSKYLVPPKKKKIIDEVQREKTKNYGV